MKPLPPVPRRCSHVWTHHGHERRDPYHWMRDESWESVLSDPGCLREDIRRHLGAENQYADACLGPLRELRLGVEDELRALAEASKELPPARFGDYDYFERYACQASQPSYWRRNVLSGEEQELFDAEAEGSRFSYFRLRDLKHSPDHERLVVAFDTAGGESFALETRELGGGPPSLGRVEGTSGQAVWSASSEAFYYVALDERRRPTSVYRHTVGQPQERDVLIYREREPGFFVSLTETETLGLICVSVGDHQTCELWLLDARSSDVSLRCVMPRKLGRSGTLSFCGDRLFLRHDEGAPDFSVYEAAFPSRCFSQVPVVKERAGVWIRELMGVPGYLARIEVESARQRVVVKDLSNGRERSLQFEGGICDIAFVRAPSLNQFRIAYSSPRAPRQVVDYDVETGQLTELSPAVDSTHDADQYVLRQERALAPDGERVPVTLLFSRDTPVDGTAPVWAHGYGSYGVNVPVRFDPRLIALARCGFIVALAHVRGGRDCGQRWYEAGRQREKSATFSDFVAVLEHLIASRYTSAGRIVCHGASAGGLLVGAVLNARPELLAAAIAEVPFVDALTTGLDASLPLTPREWPEWGNPLQSESDYHNILAYSPVDNVKDGAYPPVLATGGLCDPNVPYWEPAKWVAQLRAHQQGTAPVVLRMRMNGGHLGSSGRFANVEEAALMHAFALAALKKGAAGASCVCPSGHIGPKESLGPS